MKKLIIFLFTLSLLVASTTIFASPVKKINKSYKCKHVGIQKVKPYSFRHFRSIRHFGYITIKFKADAKFGKK